MKRLVNKAIRISLPLLALALFTASHLRAAETMESLIAGAKKEDELVFIAGAQTFVEEVLHDGTQALVY